MLRSPAAPDGGDGDAGGRRDLIAPEAATAIILDAVDTVAGTETVSLAGAVGRVAAAACRSAVDLPRFDNAAVDGYGLHGDDLHNDDLRAAGPRVLSLPVAGRVAAGHRPAPLRPGTATRILTGAAIPAGVAAVVAHERVVVAAGVATVAEPPPIGANIRRRGEDVATATEILAAGTLVDARHAALLAAAGVDRVTVRRRVRVGVVSTGDELAEVGDRPGEAGIVDSNRPMLLALLALPAIEATDLGIVRDDPGAIAAVLAGAAATLDLVISSGGAALSDADHLEAAMIAAGGGCRSLKLALRPGKPIAKGMIGPMHVLALPGNPVAALVNFLLFGRALIRRLAGAPAAMPTGIAARTAEIFRHRPGRVEFVPVRVVGRDAAGLPLLDKLGRGGSARLMPLVGADGLARIAAEDGDVAAGGAVAFFPFAAPFAL